MVEEKAMDESKRMNRRELIEKKEVERDGLRSCLAVLGTPFTVFLLLLTIELTVSILQLLCSHLILIPGLLRSVSRRRPRCDVL